MLCTEPTRDLSAILLPDSGYLNERDADFANRHGFSRHHPALPLYTKDDAIACLDLFRAVAFDAPVDLPGGMSVRFRPAGHILGAAIIELDCGGRRVVFSGDLGRPGSATMVDPAPAGRADYLIVESTYGNRRHETSDPEDTLAEVIGRTAGRGGSVIVPAFAVGRTQTLLYHLHRLKRDGRIPDLPVFLDSPMAINASELFCKHAGHHRLSAGECQAACGVARYVREVEESKTLDRDAMPKVIVSASGMATGGRVLHHLKHYLPDPRNAVVFTGFQAGGTRGDSLTAGAESVKIHGRYVPVRAEVTNLQMMSAHADADEILAWLRGFEAAPEMTFVTHGEPAAADALRHRIEETLGWPCTVPDFRDRVELG